MGTHTWIHLRQVREIRRRLDGSSPLDMYSNAVITIRASCHLRRAFVAGGERPLEGEVHLCSVVGAHRDLN